MLEGLGFGAFIGLALGSLGAGGSILTVPILVYAMGAPVQTATGTSLAIVGMNAFAGALMHVRRRRALPRVGLGVGASGLAGALGGAWLNHQVRGEVILILFACLMVVVGVGLLRRYPAVVRAPVSAECLTLASWGRIAAVGLGVGVLTGFFGVGGGFLIVPALVLVLGLPMSQAVGTSLIAKQRQHVTSISAEVHGEQDHDPPWAYRTIDIVFTIRGRRLDRCAVDRALDLALERYCSVGATLAGTATISHRAVIEQEEPVVAAVA